MKPNKLMSIIFAAAVVTVLTTVSVFNLIRRDEQSPQKTSVPIATEISVAKHIQPTEPVTKELKVADVKPVPEPTQLPKATPKVVKVAKPAIAKTTPAPKPAVSAGPKAFIPVESEPATETFTEEPISAPARTGRHHGIIGYNSRAVPGDLRNTTIPNAAEHNRHREMYRTIA
ncbi:MAG: hypothetical protein JW956_03240, partial [Calditrichaceae bacterium]|nr:hypothetical protein [Calditrichaceae bacterium]